MLEIFHFDFVFVPCRRGRWKES